jgi:hypothetical protein
MLSFLLDMSRTHFLIIVVYNRFVRRLNFQGFQNFGGLWDKYSLYRTISVSH